MNNELTADCHSNSNYTLYNRIAQIRRLEKQSPDPLEDRLDKVIGLLEAIVSKLQ